MVGAALVAAVEDSPAGGPLMLARFNTVLNLLTYLLRLARLSSRLVGVPLCAGVLILSLALLS